ncbi:MAG: RidA family protein [Sediminibacterium sp.]|jgi:2-iminobutanoate/2-iminopropanoate deaminase|nr:RidA family protein [Chitinophagaceae bacterium]MCA6445565.1 RidA family protein [Chitinophagaceae bacterium]
MSIQYLSPDSVQKPKGHYSPGVVHNGTVYVAGQLPIDKDGVVHAGTIEEQTTLCLQNIQHILEAAGSDLNHALKIGVFISDIALWPRFNETYKNIMGDHKPARIVVPCNQLNYGCTVEIDCIAAVK